MQKNDTLHALVLRTRSASQCLPALRDADRIKRWLATARRAQWVAAGCLVFGLFVFPALRDALVTRAFPAVTKRGILGLTSKREASPYAAPARTALTTAYWLGSAVAVGWLLLLHVPVAVRGKNEEDPQPCDPAADATLPGSAFSIPMSQISPVDATQLPDVAPAIGDTVVGETALVGHRYRIIEKIGEGGMGVVYRAHDVSLERDVALKQLLDTRDNQAQLVERFKREARVLARLSHPNIVQVYDLVETGSRLWIAMELVTGGSLDAALERRDAWSASRALELAGQMADAMAHAHEQGVVHRDFKPANVLLTRDERVKVTDFGLAKLIRSETKLTQAGAVMGSPAYMSPEQACGDTADARSDIYAFGATLHEMLAGRPPFTGDVAQVLTQHITKPAPDIREHRPDVPEAVAVLIASMLEKSPSDRPADLSQVAVALRKMA